jgi:saccharopine dehydrogenase-like NADP-dependent oxidoreductase
MIWERSGWNNIYDTDGLFERLTFSKSAFFMVVLLSCRLNSSMKNILLFGAGKSATCLIEYLIKEITTHNWQLTIADSNLALIQSKTGEVQNTKAVAIQIENELSRKQLVQEADIVISLLPASLHFLIAKDCIEFKKNLLTASYLDE